MFRRVALLTTTALMTVISMAGPARATFPGRSGKIAFTNGAYQIATMNPDGSAKHQLTHFRGSHFAEAPQFTADGMWIVLDASAHGQTDIYTMRSDGSRLRQITDDAVYQWGPSWSPDGRKIVYASDAASSPIFIINRDGTHPHALGSAVGEYPRYSPNGNKIAYGGSDGLIHVVNPDGSHDHALTSGPEVSDYPDWSPDGRRIAYSSDRSGSHQVWIMNADGSHDHQVTSTGDSFVPVFSPDGTRILYWNGDKGSTSALFVSRLDGSSRHKVVSTSGCCAGWQALP